MSRFRRTKDELARNLSQEEALREREQKKATQSRSPSDGQKNTDGRIEKKKDRQETPGVVEQDQKERHQAAPGIGPLGAPEAPIAPKMGPERTEGIQATPETGPLGAPKAPDAPEKGSSDRKRKKPSFRISAKKLWLTYAQSGCLSAKAAVDQLKDTLDQYDPVAWCAAKEKHESDGYHLHVYLELGRKANIRSPYTLELQTSEGQFLKGNYQAAKRPEAIFEYITKDLLDQQQILDETTFFGSSKIVDRLTAKGTLQDIDQAAIRLAEEGQVDKALGLYRHYKPSTFVMKHMQLEKSMRELFVKTKGYRSKFSLENFDAPQGLHRALEHTVGDPRSSLALIGRPGTGKTQFILAWAEAQGMIPLVIKHLQGIKAFSPEIHTCIVLDDCAGMNSRSREELLALLGAEEPADIRVLYGLVKIPADVPRYLLTNRSLKETLGPIAVDPGLLDRRIRIYDLGDRTLICSKAKDLAEQREKETQEETQEGAQEAQRSRKAHDTKEDQEKDQEEAQETQRGRKTHATEEN